MNNKTEIAFGKHIERLESEIEGRLETIKRHNLGRDGFESQLNRDDAKKIALLREGLVPKYSDLPQTSAGLENNLPDIEMFEFSDIIDETGVTMDDLDLLIDHAKEHIKEDNHGKR